MTNLIVHKSTKLNGSAGGWKRLGSMERVRFNLENVMTNKIDSFQGEYRFLSNFWYVKVLFDGVDYRSVEHAYMAAKTEDVGLRMQIQAFEKPGDVKRFCKTIKLRGDWEDVKFGIMLGLVRQQFANEHLRSKLLATGDAELIEGNTWGDVYWGVCRGKGQNNLGKILMQVRQELAVE